MHGPPLVAWLLVALSTAAAAACALRGQSRQEALTGAGMAAMALPLSVADPWRWAAPVLAVVFACAVLYTLARPAAHAGHRTHHAVCSASMVYMALAMAGTASGTAESGAHGGHGMPGMRGGAGVPLLTGLLLLYFAGYVVRTGVRVVAVAPVAVPGAGPKAGSPAGAGAAPGGGISGRAARGTGPHTARLRHTPEVVAACRVSMALAMFAMLVLL